MLALKKEHNNVSPIPTSLLASNCKVLRVCDCQQKFLRPCYLLGQSRRPPYHYGRCMAGLECSACRKCNQPHQTGELVLRFFHTVLVNR